MHVWNKSWSIYMQYNFSICFIWETELKTRSCNKSWPGSQRSGPGWHCQRLETLRSAFYCSPMLSTLMLSDAFYDVAIFAFAQDAVWVVLFFFIILQFFRVAVIHCMPALLCCMIIIALCAILCNNIIMLYDVAVFAGGEADLHCIPWNGVAFYCCLKWGCFLLHEIVVAFIAHQMPALPHLMIFHMPSALNTLSSLAQVLRLINHDPDLESAQPVFLEAFCQTLMCAGIDR